MPAPVAVPPKKLGWFQRLASGLKRSSDQLTGGLTSVFTKKKLDQAMLDDLEDILIQADFGIDMASTVTAALRKDRFDRDISGEEVRARDLLRPVPRKMLQEVLPRAGPQVEHAHHAGRAGVARGAHHAASRGPTARAAAAPARRPPDARIASGHRAQSLARRRRRRLGEATDVGSSVGDENVTETCARAAASASTSASRTMSGPRVMRPNGVAPRQRLTLRGSAGSGPRPAGTGRWRADGDRLVPPGRRASSR